MSLSEELQALSNLHSSGELTDAEFDSAKARLLSARPDARRTLSFVAMPDFRNRRVQMTIASALAASSIFMPWVDFTLIRISAVEAVQLALRARGLSEQLARISGTPIDETGSFPAIAIAFIILLAGAIAAPAARTARTRALQGAVGSFGSLLIAGYTLTQGESSLDFVGLGAWVCGASMLALLSISITELFQSIEKHRHTRSNRPRPWIIESQNGRMLLAGITGAALLLAIIAWMFGPDTAQGPIEIRYEQMTGGSDESMPQATATVRVVTPRGENVVAIPPAIGGSLGDNVRTWQAGEWRSGENIVIDYEPSFSFRRARAMGLSEDVEVDEFTRFGVTVPDAPRWRSRFSREPLAIAVTVGEDATVVDVTHVWFDSLISRTLRRVDESVILRDHRSR